MDLWIRTPRLRWLALDSDRSRTGWELQQLLRNDATGEEKWEEVPTVKQSNDRTDASPTSTGD